MRLLLGRTIVMRNSTTFPSIDVVLDVVIDFAGVGVTIQDAMMRVKSSGTVFLVGNRSSKS